MAVVQFPVKTKYDGVWQPPHTPFKVRNADVPELVSSGAVVLADEEEREGAGEGVETEEEKQERLIAEAKAEEERLAAEESQNAGETTPEDTTPKDEKKPSRAAREK